MHAFKLRGICISLILMAFSQLVGAASFNTHNPKTLSTKSAIRYVTGGIGEEDADAMRAQAKQFTLNLLFSEGTSGRWVTGANVNIYDEASNLVFRIIDA